MQKVAEFAPLLALLGRQSPSTVVEIGTARGGSFYAFCQVAAPSATLISVDIPGGLFGGGYGPNAVPVLRSYGLPGQSLHFIAADSQSASTRDEVANLAGKGSIDFLMIDGDHRLNGVRRDFELYSPLVAIGGLVAFHDILPHPEQVDVEVDVLWRELRQQYPHREFVDAAEDWGAGKWGGIGVAHLDGSTMPRS